jgi:hypothetical protein
MDTAEPNYQIEFIQDSQGTHVLKDNLDVVVQFEDGRRYAATFFTLENIETLMHRYQETGECLGGQYFWSSSMIIVRDLRRETIEACVAALIATGEFEEVFEK